MFPDPQNSAEYYIYDLEGLYSQPHTITLVTKDMLKLPGISAPIHQKLHIGRTLEDQYSIFVPLLEPGSGHIKSVQGLDLYFDKDKYEELSGVKMPLMLVGVGCAFVYQLFCRGSQTRKDSKYSKPQHSNYTNQRISNLSKRITKLEGSYKK